MKLFNMADLILLKAGRNSWGHFDLNNVFLDEERNFVENI